MARLMREMGLRGVVRERRMKTTTRTGMRSVNEDFKVSCPNALGRCRT